MKRNLYQCSHAKVLGDRIHCTIGRPLSTTKDKTIPVLRLIRGEPLELTICQKCLNYEELGPPILKDERGWMTVKEANV